VLAIWSPTQKTRNALKRLTIYSPRAPSLPNKAGVNAQHTEIKMLMMTMARRIAERLMRCGSHASSCGYTGDIFAALDANGKKRFGLAMVACKRKAERTEQS